MSNFQPNDNGSPLAIAFSNEQLEIQSLIAKASELADIDAQQAISICQEAQARSVSIDFRFGIACALAKQAVYRFKLTEYDLSLQLAFDALERFSLLDDDFGQSICLKTIGCVYAAFSQPQKSLEYLLSALSRLLPLSEPHLLGDKNSELGIITTNIGACYQQLKDYEQALSYYLKAMDYLSHSADLTRLASCTTNLGALYSSLKKPDEAIVWLERAIAHARASKQSSALLAALINLSATYRQIDKLDKALSLLQDALAVVSETGEQRHLDSLYIELSDIYEQLGDYKQALAYHKKYVEVSEKQFGKQMTEKINALEIQFALKEAKKNEQLAEQSEKIKQLEEMVTICAWSGQIKMGNKWVRVEEFLQKKFGFKVSHGITDAMAEKLRQQHNGGKLL